MAAKCPADDANISQYFSAEEYVTLLLLLPLQMRGLTKEHLADIVAKFEPCPENLQRMVLGIDGTYSTIHVSWFYNIREKPQLA